MVEHARNYHRDQFATDGSGERVRRFSPRLGKREGPAWKLKDMPHVSAWLIRRSIVKPARPTTLVRVIET